MVSEMAPLHVDFLPASVISLPGRLGMTIAPGKRVQDMQTTCDRNLKTDLARLRQFYQTDLLVSLIGAEEMALLQIPNLLTEVVRQGMESVWFPIPDFGYPPVMADFANLVQGILAAVATGQTVVIHCRAGLGRSGLVVVACLVKLGYLPPEALAIVRLARPGTVETLEQESYLQQFAALG